MKDAKNLSYGRPLLKKLTAHANQLGCPVQFHINADGKYVINDGNHLHYPPSATTACHFLMGIVSALTPKTKV